MKTQDLTRGSVLGNIFTFSLPYMLAYFLQMLYGLADMFFIGLYCGVDSITAVSNGAQVMHLITVVLIGFAMGTTVRTARAVGANDQSMVAKVVGNTVTLFSLVAVVLTVVLLSSHSLIIRAINTPVEAVEATRSYLLVCFSGIPFIVAYNIIASIFRGLGDSRSPMYFVIVACVVNILLDWLLVGQMGWGPIGAALATTLSQVASVAVSLFAMRSRHSLFQLTRNDFRLHRDTLRNILSIGVPVAPQDGFIQIAFFAITVIANGRGLVDAAAVGIVEKFIGLLFIVPSAMLSTVSAISAQCIGAGQVGRARQTMRDAVYIAGGFGLAVSLLFQFIPDLAVRLFTTDAAVIAQGSEYLRSYVLDCFLAGIHFCFSGFFVACGYSTISFCHNVVSIVFARLPLSYLFSELYPDTLYPMGLASPIGSLVSVIICVVAYRWLHRHKLAQS